MYTQPRDKGGPSPKSSPTLESRPFPFRFSHMFPFPISFQPGTISAIQLEQMSLPYTVTQWLPTAAGYNPSPLAWTPAPSMGWLSSLTPFSAGQRIFHCRPTGSFLSSVQAPCFPVWCPHSYCSPSTLPIQASLKPSFKHTTSLKHNHSSLTALMPLTCSNTIPTCSGLSMHSLHLAFHSCPPHLSN